LRRILTIVVAILITQQFINAASLFNELNTEILEMNGRTATIKNSDDIVVGSSGIVTHILQKGVSTIVARADVIQKNGDTAIIKFEVFDMLAQEAFPKPGVIPRVGDKVTLNYLYDRALIVAPNYDVYKEVTSHFKDIQWIHPDLVGAYLAKKNKPNPDRKTFQEICSLNSASLIFFALNDNGYFVDCHNFKTVKKVKTGVIKTAQVPFYTRVKDIDTNWFNWNSSQITDYNGHYRNVIGQ